MATTRQPIKSIRRRHPYIGEPLNGIQSVLLHPVTVSSVKPVRAAGSAILIPLPLSRPRIVLPLIMASVTPAVYPGSAKILTLPGRINTGRIAQSITVVQLRAGERYFYRPIVLNYLPEEAEVIPVDFIYCVDGEALPDDFTAELLPDEFTAEGLCD